MKINNTAQLHIPIIRTLCKNKSEEQIVDAESRFSDLVQLATRIHNRLQTQSSSLDLMKLHEVP